MGVRLFWYDLTRSFGFGYSEHKVRPKATEQDPQRKRQRKISQCLSKSTVKSQRAISLKNQSAQICVRNELAQEPRLLRLKCETICLSYFPRSGCLSKINHAHCSCSSVIMAHIHNEDDLISYRSFVAAQSQRFSSLQELTDFLDRSPASQRICPIKILEFLEGSRNHYSLDLEGLATLLQGTAHTNKSLHGRLIIIEDLSTDLIEILGCSLNIDPLFFASHIDTSRADITRARPSLASLPSTIRSQKFVNLHYHQVLELDSQRSRQALSLDMNLGRKVTILPQLKGSNIRLARYYYSVL